MHILSVGASLCIFAGTFCTFTMYLLNVPTCVNQLVFPYIYSSLVYHSIY